MKANIKLLILALALFSLPASAGLLWNIVKVGTVAGVGAAAYKGVQAREVRDIKRKVTKANSKLWKMHILQEYSESYPSLIDYIKQSGYIEKSPGIADTVAWVYFDNEEYEKSIEIYNTHIMPWLDDVSVPQQEKFEQNFQNIKDV